MSTITVQSMKNILDHDFSKQRRKEKSLSQNKYVFIPADKAPNSIVIICKRYYIETLIKELGFSTPTGNSTYTSCQMSSEDIVSTHDTFIKSLGIELSEEDKRLPHLYWTPKLHKSPVKYRFIAGSSKCTTKQLSSLLTKIQS